MRMASSRVASRGQHLCRKGLTLIEALVVLSVVVLIALFVVAVLPKARENARAAQCRAHLMDIGTAMALYDNAVGHLPSVPAVGQKGDAPLPAMLGQLGVRRFAGLSKNHDQAKSMRPGSVPEAFVMPELTCPSDTWARERDTPAPVSYRACSGGDPEGRTGAFPSGGVVSLEQVRALDGTEYTAAFCERLVGNGQDEPALNNYAVVNGLLLVKQPPPDAWRGDAGSDWSEPGYVSSQYNHALVPGGYPSLISTDHRSALMSGSSAHVEGVHVLRLDTSVQAVSTTINPEVWRRLGTIDDSSSKKTPAIPSQE